MPIEDFVNNFLNEPGDDPAKDDIKALMASHLRSGAQLQQAGKLREAIEEYQREHSRTIRSDIDAEIVQSSYWHVGKVHQMLGDLDQAAAAFEKARGLLKQYGVGSYPYGDLAEVYIAQGHYDLAIAVCEEWAGVSPSRRAQEVLERVNALKGNQPE